MKPLLLSFVALALLSQSGALSAQQGLGGAGQALPASILQCADVAAALMAVTNQDTRLRDWANLARYRDANKTVTRADAVFMGDSITDFWQQARFGGFFPGKSYVDRGISAQTTPQMLIRFRPDVIALKPTGGRHSRGHERYRRQHGPDDQRRHPEQSGVDGRARESEQHPRGAREHHAGQRLSRGAECPAADRHDVRSSASRPSTRG